MVTRQALRKQAMGKKKPIAWAGPVKTGSSLHFMRARPSATGLPDDSTRELNRAPTTITAKLNELCRSVNSSRLPINHRALPATGWSCPQDVEDASINAEAQTWKTGLASSTGLSRAATGRHFVTTALEWACLLAWPRSYVHLPWLLVCYEEQSGCGLQSAPPRLLSLWIPGRSQGCGARSPDGFLKIACVQFGTQANGRQPCNKKPSGPAWRIQ